MKTAERFASVWTSGAALLLAGLFAGCATSTKVVQSWTTPDFKAGSVKKMFVVGVSQDQALRRIYEETFAAEIRKRHFEAGPSYARLPDLGNVDKEAVAASLREDGFTHVLVTRVVNIEDKATYHPPSMVVVGGGYGGYPGYYGGWYPYMSMTYGYATSPGYTTVNRLVGLETNVYDLGSGTLIYSCLTESWIGESPSSHIKKVIDTVAWDLRSKGVL